jgi:phosphoserine aminotransferase
MLPLEVLEDAGANITDYADSGMSVMEMSHRSKYFQKVIDDAEANLRELMHIPDDYAVLFLQGGATLQFAMVALNFMNGSGKADYIVSGTWSDKAAKEASKYGDVKVVASSKESTYSYIPKVKKEEFRADADYVHITSNNTIYGTSYYELPDTGDIPIIADMSSNILSVDIDVTKYGVIYAGAQKNVGPAGLTIVIARKDLIGKARPETPTYLNYQIHADNGSMYNTPPAWCIYVAGEVFKQLLAKGGLPAMETFNREKAAKLYSYIDESKLYSNPNAVEDRSLMNVVFVTGDADLDKKFVAEAAAEGLVTLNGHRSIGGMRASIYNAMPMAGVDKLIAFMQKFEEANA